MEAFFSQSVICYLSGAIPSNVSRYMTSSDISPVKRGKRKSFSYQDTRKLVKHFGYKGLVPKKKVQVFFNFKGGTGKTSVCYHISSFFALCGFNVLVVDCDPQAHLSYSWGFDIYDDYKTLYDVIVNHVPFEEAVVEVCEGVHCLPSNLSLTRLELPLNQMPNRERVFGKLISPIKDKYDFIFIDTNPTISTINRNVTLASDELNVVCETQPYSLRGLEILIDEILHLSEVMDMQISYKIIPNKYESKTATSQEALGKLRLDYKNHLMNSVIRKCEDVNVAAKRMLPVFFWGNKNSNAFEDFCDLGKEMIENSTSQGTFYNTNNQ
ncbi:ParA family protein [Candidatus Sneabacter namystus]|uniref:ParA family protein n=1 Tax=Candidatus Sneabacter namystus TaxID=2601646 RepID=A0A5C0UIJ9_9RICK|nr:ParA family protein [Candidatus Sneabacter namystus]QEK39896.1 ParA family protein [Candidatus Sneabacter namystus]